MQSMTDETAKWFLVLVSMVAVLITAKSPLLTSLLLGDLGRVSLLRASQCPPTDPTCRSTTRLPYRPSRGLAFPPPLWSGNREILKKSKHLLELAVTWGAGSRTYEHLAIAMYSLENREEARHLVSRARQIGTPLTFWDLDIPESDVLEARGKASEQEWGGAVRSYQSALVGGAQEWTDQDYRHFYYCLYQYYFDTTTGTEERDEARCQYLAGKYAYKAGLSDEAYRLLTGTLSISDTLSLDERAIMNFILGSIAREQGKLSLAGDHFVEALRYDSRELRAYQELAALSRLNGQSAIQINVPRLLPSAPLYSLEESTSIQFDDGWQLYGYDILDEQALEIGAEIPIALWWQSLGGRNPTGDGWIRIGESWVHLLEATNLAPNAGFEWERQHWPQAAIPGYPFNPCAPPLVKDSPSWPHSIRSVSRPPNDTNSNVVRLETTEERVRTGLTTYIIPVDPGAKYILAGMLDSSQGGNAALEVAWLGCPGCPRFGRAVSSLYRQEWNSYSAVLVPPAGTRNCRIRMLNYQSRGTALFDNILFFPVYLPN